jgi:hypothetical protein
VIRVQLVGARLEVTVGCDACGLPIEDASRASVLIEAGAVAGRQGEPAPVAPLFVHKACDPDMQRRSPGRRYLWQSLTSFCVYLPHSVGIPWGDKGAADTARFHGNL